MAIEQQRKALELDPNYWFAHAYLGLAYLQKSQHKEAIAEAEKAVALSPSNSLALSILGYCYGVAGRRVEAEKILEPLNEASKRKYVPAYYLALIYAGLGEKDMAFEWLEKGYQDHLLPSFTNVTPTLDPLRPDPRFADLVRRMGLPQ